MKQKKSIIRKMFALLLAAATIISGIMVSPSTAEAAGWLDYAQEITLGVAVTNSVKDGDYKGKFSPSSSNYFWNIYKFTIPKDGQLHIYYESEAEDYFWNSNYLTIYSALDPDNHIWDFYQNNKWGKPYEYSAARSMYYDSIEIALSKGEYYFALRTLSVINTPYYLTLSYTEPVINVNAISLSPSSLSMEIGDQKTIIPTILPDNATDKTLVWKSENPFVATVENGIVNAVSIGTTSVSASSLDGEIKAVCPITVECNHNYEISISPAGIDYSGYISKICTKCGTETEEQIAAIADIRFSDLSYSYNGKIQRPLVTVRDTIGKLLQNSTDYTISYTGNQRDVGVHTVTVTFIGNYSGSISKKFTIRPESTTITQIKSKKNGFSVFWKKQYTQTTGYEIAYSTSYSFRKNNTKSVTVNQNKASKTISKLKKGKQYYVRIRTYKDVMVNGQNTRLYSGWSTANTVITKK